jgi:hypothetical protein
MIRAIRSASPLAAFAILISAIVAVQYAKVIALLVGSVPPPGERGLPGQGRPLRRA